MKDYWDVIPPASLESVAALAAAIIERAHSFGPGRWGATPYTDAFRVNVGWTEILTANSDGIRLIVDGASARSLLLPRGATLDAGDDERGFYPTIPGSVLVTLSYRPKAAFSEALAVLSPALSEAVRLAARRRTGRGVKAGHRQQVVIALASLLGRDLPSPDSGADVTTSVGTGATKMEGALRRVVSSEYERNSAARGECIDHYGAACLVCGFSFEAVYGPLGAGFIHVHHRVPVSSRGGPYIVKPVEDLAPVCPNCHAMLHQREPPLTLQALRDLIAQPPEA